MKRHPLRPLADLREKQAENASKVLGNARDASLQAARTLSAAEQARVDLQRAIGEEQQRCQQELTAGQLRASDLRQAAEWSVGAALRQADADERTQQAEASLQHAQSAVEEARQAAAQAKADADVVDELLQKARSAQLAKETAQLEEAAEDAFLARRSLASRGRA